MSATDNLADYVTEHTSCSETHWREVGPEQRGPFPVSAVSGIGDQGIAVMPKRETFLELVRSHREEVRSDQGEVACDPLDGAEHGLSYRTSLMR